MRRPPPRSPLFPYTTLFRSENVMEGVAATKALLDRFEAVSARFAEPLDDDEMTKLIAEQGELQEKIDAADAGDLQCTVEIARSEEHTSELESQYHLVCRLLL